MANITEQRVGSIDMDGLFRHIERLEDENKRLTEQLKESNSNYDIVSQKTDTWRECMCQYNSNFSTEETLDFIKETAKDFDLDDTDVKNIFDECEDPFYYDLDKKEIINGDESEEEESEEENQ